LDADRPAPFQKGTFAEPTVPIDGPGFFDFIRQRLADERLLFVSQLVELHVEGNPAQFHARDRFLELNPVLHSGLVGAGGEMLVQLQAAFAIHIAVVGDSLQGLGAASIKPKVQDHVLQGLLVCRLHVLEFESGKRMREAGS
jgi:hypothetical protein